MIQWLKKIVGRLDGYDRDLPLARKIYFIPGFGTDEKIFANLRLDNVVMRFLNWLDPLPRESYQSYVARMASAIDDDDPIIVGVSFGGMVALEIAKIRPVKQIILISSIKTSKELPRKWRLVGRLKLNRIFPIKRIQTNERFYALANKRVGAFTGQEQEFANNYRRTIRANYMVWALNQILNWKNDQYPENIIHIHGTDDMIFPVKATKPTHLIQGGTHMMVVNRAKEISDIINTVLKKLQESKPVNAV